MCACVCLVMAVETAPSVPAPQLVAGTCPVMCESGLGCPDAWREDVSAGKFRTEMDLGDEGKKGLRL